MITIIKIIITKITNISKLIMKVTIKSIIISKVTSIFKDNYESKVHELSLKSYF